MGTGDTRGSSASERAISSPLLETSIEGARSILLSITGGRDLSLVEISEAARVIQEAAHPEAHIIFGANVDDDARRADLGDRDRDPLRRPWASGRRQLDRGEPVDGTTVLAALLRRELPVSPRAGLRGAPGRPRHRRPRVHPQLERGPWWPTAREPRRRRRRASRRPPKPAPGRCARAATPSTRRSPPWSLRSPPRAR